MSSSFFSMSSLGEDVIDWIKNVEGLCWKVIEAFERDNDKINAHLGYVAVDYAKAAHLVLDALGPEFRDLVNKRGKNPIEFFMNSKPDQE